SSARKASRTGPRDTPSRSAIAASLSLLPAGSSPARIMRSSSCWTSAGSELDWRSAMASAPRREVDGDVAVGEVDADFAVVRAGGLRDDGRAPPLPPAGVVFSILRIGPALV